MHVLNAEGTECSSNTRRTSHLSLCLHNAFSENLRLFISVTTFSSESAKIGELREKILNLVIIVYASDTTLRGFCLTIFANNYIFLREGKWNEFSMACQHFFLRKTTTRKTKVSNKIKRILAF